MIRASIRVGWVMLVAVPLVAQQDKTLDLATYLDWERVSGPQVSPDGQHVIYTRSRIDKINDRWDSELWIMTADGSRNRYLTDGSSARWSPDGTRIAFTRASDDEGEGSQIFVRWMDAEGATSQITHVEESPGSIRWAPDGDRIAFVMNVQSDEGWRVSLPARPEGAKWTADPKVVTRLNYRRDRQGFIDDGYRHLFVVSATGGTPRQLTDGDWNHGSGDWTPDGSELVFSSHRIPEAEHDWRQSDV